MNFSVFKREIGNNSRIRPFLYDDKTGYSAEFLSPENHEKRNQWKLRLIERSDDLSRVFEIFMKSKIVWFTAKGFSLGVTAYDDVFRRPFSDLDIFVAEDNYSKAADLLEAVGGVDQKNREKDIHGVFRMPSGLTVELHHHLSREHWYGEKLYKDMLKNVLLMQYGKIHFCVPPMEMHALYIVLHAFNHSFLLDVSWMYDLLLVMNKAGMTSDFLAELGDKYGMGDIVKTGIFLCSRYIEGFPEFQKGYSVRQIFFARIISRFIERDIETTQRWSWMIRLGMAPGIIDGGRWLSVKIIRRLRQKCLKTNT
ncbi:MAG: nucleotidyltransferase family protein [Deltaproteobacteria bacterium]|nr:nucleotidyltransferase family protein [Deltaproteobacteria bacterium]